MPSLPTGTVTFLLTDVESSTRLWEEYPEAMRTDLALQDRVIEQLVTTHGGTLVRPRGEGDSRFAVFAQAGAALRAACSIQLALNKAEWHLPEPLRVRMALHTGEADLRDGDYYGSAVNRCARLRSLGYGSQILLSGTTAAIVRDQPIAGIRLRSLGIHKLKDLAEPEHVFQLLSAGLASEFPPLQSAAIPRTNLAVQLTAFIGRQHELAEAKKLLSSTHLLTLTGPGGVGKTRLVQELAAGLQDTFSDGVWFVELAPVGDPALIASAIAVVVGMSDEPSRPLAETLTIGLRDKRVLLVLDNCEHVVQACARLAEQLLRACPDLRVVATSREPLGLGGEAVLSVPPLRLPAGADLEDLRSSEAVQLFVQRAQAVQNGFTLDERNAAAIAQVCNRVDGLPLAIELAAVRVRALDVGAIATLLADRFGLLSTTSRVEPPRHHTLRAAIDWSYDLLSEKERALFNRLAVFAGGWTLEAAEAVCADDIGHASEVLELLVRLVDRSLVVAQDQAGRMRYRLLEPLRQYAAQRLEEAGEQVDIRERHRAWCLTFAEQAERDIWRADQLTCIARLEQEHDNLRTALSWTISGASDPEPGLRIAVALVRFWDLHSYLREGSKWLTDLLALPGARRSVVTLARGVTALGYLTVLCGDASRAANLLDEGLTYWRMFGDSRGLAVGLFFRALAWTAVDLDQAELVGTESLQFSRQRGPRWTTYLSLLGLGHVARSRRDYERADELLTESLSLARQAGDRWGSFHCLCTLSLLELARGDTRRATGFARDSLLLTLELGDKRSSTYALEALACIAAAQGHAWRAARLLGAARALREPIADFIWVTLVDDRELAIAQARARLGELDWTAAWAAGRRMSLEQAVGYALSPARQRARHVRDGEPEPHQGRRPAAQRPGARVAPASC